MALKIIGGGLLIYKLLKTGAQAFSENFSWELKGLDPGKLDWFNFAVDLEMLVRNGNQVPLPNVEVYGQLVQRGQVLGTMNSIHSFTVPANSQITTRFKVMLNTEQMLLRLIDFLDQRQVKDRVYFNGAIRYKGRDIPINTPVI